MGRDGALVGSAQTLSLIPGLAGQYLRRAFLNRVLDGAAPTRVSSPASFFTGRIVH
jgi:hypothetical protein